MAKHSISDLRTDHDLVRALRAQGRTYKSIGREVGRSKQRVAQILQGYGEAGYHRCQCGRAIMDMAKDKCPRCYRISNRPKPVTQVELFTCRRCGKEFTLSGLLLTRQRANIRNKHLTGAFCLECRATRQHGPLVLSCWICGELVFFTGNKAAYYRWKQRIGQTIKPRCPSCSQPKEITRKELYGYCKP